MKQTENPFTAAWRRLEETVPQPTRYHGLVVMEWDEFAAHVRAGAPWFVRCVTESIYRGEIWLLRRAFRREFMEELKTKTAAWMRSQPSSFHKMLEGSPDFHRVIDLEAGKKYAFRACKHAAYFYRWNSDPLGIYPTIDERWRVAKLAMGLREDEYEKFTPKDGVVDRIQVVRYPPAIGYLEPHSDPWQHNRLFFSSYMSRRGPDYEGGGFYAVDKNNRAVSLEDQIKVGDSTLGYATVVHGVAPCDRGKPMDWDAEDGRWFLSLYSNASDEVAKRHTGAPERLEIEGVMP